MKIQARITLPTKVRQEIDRLRLTWNPERAAGNAAHVTVTYHDEAPDADLLAERLRFAAAQTSPFRLIIGEAAKFPKPASGAFLSVADPTGGVASIRKTVLAPPFACRQRFGLHITLLHPDQGERLQTAWPAFVGLATVGSFEVEELEMIGPDNAVMAVFALSGTELDNSKGL